MAGLFDILSQSSMSMGAQQGVTATASNNLANSATPGYSRQEAVVVDVQGPMGLGGGARLDTIQQKRDRYIEAQLPAAFGQAAYSQAQADAMSGVTVLDPATGSGLDDALSGFFSSLQALSQNAGDTALRQGVVSAAQKLATAFNRTAQGLSQPRTAIDQQLSAEVPVVNRLAAQVAQLNGQIRGATASGAQPNDLLDARQRAVDQLAQLTGATPVTDGAGDVSLSLAGGQPLVNVDSAAQLSVAADPSNGGHFALQITRADGSGPFASGASAIGGTLGGQLAARDGALKQAESSIDQLAWDAGGALNTAHAAGYALDGTSGHALFDLGAGASGAASRIAVDSAVAGNPSLVAAAGSSSAGAGDATNLFSVMAVAQQSLSSGADAVSTLASAVATFGSAASGAQAVSAQDKAIQDHLTTMRDSTSGVSVDEELIKMQQAQRTYEAITKVISATTSMLDSLLSIGSGG